MQLIRNGLLGLLLAFAHGSGASIPVPVVAANAMEIEVLRTGSILLRYVRFNTESDYPCLRFEIIQPEQGWRPAALRDVCAIAPAGTPTIGFLEDVAFVEFLAIRLHEAGLQFTVGYSPRVGTGEYRSDCQIEVIGRGRLGDVQCGTPVRI